MKQSEIARLKMVERSRHAWEQPLHTSTQRFDADAVRLDCHLSEDGPPWIVYGSGGKVLGTHPTKEEAVAQLQAIQMH